MALSNSYRTSSLSNAIGSVYRLAGASYWTYYNDVTSGSNGAYTAAGAYDDVTGLGTPRAAKLVPALSAN